MAEDLQTARQVGIVEDESSVILDDAKGLPPAIGRCVEQSQDGLLAAACVRFPRLPGRPGRGRPRPALPPLGACLAGFAVGRLAVEGIVRQRRIVHHRQRRIGDAVLAEDVVAKSPHIHIPFPQPLETSWSAETVQEQVFGGQQEGVRQVGQ